MPFGWADQQGEVEEFASSGGLAPESQQCWNQYRIIQSELDNIKKSTHPEANVSSEANISGPVYIDSGAQILPGAYIEGPTYIGKNALVGTSTLVRGGSFLGKNSIIGNHCHCTSAVIGPESGVFHHNGISRSIIGRNCHITIFVATGTTRPDLKPVVPDPEFDDLDEIKKRGSIIRKGTYISPNVFISPDTEIGEHCAIGPYVHVTENIDPETYLKVDFQTTSRKNKITDVRIDDPPKYPFQEDF